jgi:hypothetical protein
MITCNKDRDVTPANRVYSPDVTRPYTMELLNCHNMHRALYWCRRSMDDSEWTYYFGREFVTGDELTGIFFFSSVDWYIQFKLMGF